MDHETKYLPCSNIQEKDRACLQLFCTAIIINCILIAALSVTVYYWKRQGRLLTFSGHGDVQQIFCINCERISIHPLDDDNLLKDFERKDNGTKCCAKDTSKVKHLVHQFLERNRRISKAKGNVSENFLLITEGIVIPNCSNDENVEKPAGRVVGVNHDQTGIDSDERHIIRWLNTEKGSYQNPGVTFTDGQLEITTAGYYWFNSRVTFWDTNTTFENDRFAFFHSIYRRPAEYPLREDWKLVEAGKTRCKLRSGFTDRSSFIGDIAFFKKGERIIVTVSHPEMVSLTLYDSFLEVRLY